MASAENVPGPNAPSNKDLTQSNSQGTDKAGESTLGDVSAAYNPLNIGGNDGLPKSVSSPL